MEFGGDEEIELSLGLAIGGGGCRKGERTEDLVSKTTAVVDSVKRKKEMQALRRSEARRKREEKNKRLRVVRNNSMTIQQAENDEDERREGIEAGLQPQPVKSYAGEYTEQAASAASTYAFPMYAYPSFQYVPFANGFSIPCIAPVYKTAETDVINKSLANQTVSFGSFQSGNKSHLVNVVNGLNEEGNVKAVSNGNSVGYCSSAVSENRSISSQDDSSSDSASHRTSSGSDVPGASNRKTFSNASTIINGKKANNAPLAPLPQTPSVKVSKEESIPFEPKPANVLITSSTSLPQPRPQSSEMPCVSTTGNGPDGKTITGFLYSYSTTAEVSIVCVCHGESFSPAEFVKHAGGIDIDYPLRHIIVIPSVF